MRKAGGSGLGMKEGGDEKEIKEKKGCGRRGGRGRKVHERGAEGKRR